MTTFGSFCILSILFQTLLSYRGPQVYSRCAVALKLEKLHSQKLEATAKTMKTDCCSEELFSKDFMFMSVNRNPLKTLFYFF